MGIEAKSVAIWIFTTAVTHLTGGRELLHVSRAVRGRRELKYICSYELIATATPIKCYSTYWNIQTDTCVIHCRIE